MSEKAAVEDSDINQVQISKDLESELDSTLPSTSVQDSVAKEETLETNNVQDFVSNPPNDIPGTNPDH